MGERKPDLKPGDRIGRYEILGEIGQGAFATPYLAEQRLLRRKVVIRLFTANDQNILALARRAAEILASIDHPHIVDLYDADEYEGFFFQVIEYVDGHCLEYMVGSENKLPIMVVLKLMIDIADALDHVHSLGIIHGDVKPNNIMVSSGGIPILLDLANPAIRRDAGHLSGNCRHLIHLVKHHHFSNPFHKRFQRSGLCLAAHQSGKRCHIASLGIALDDKLVCLYHCLLPLLQHRAGQVIVRVATG
jgi:serine/threonine protein kinase